MAALACTGLRIWELAGVWVGLITAHLSTHVWHVVENPGRKLNPNPGCLVARDPGVLFELQTHRIVADLIRTLRLNGNSVR